MIYNVYIIHRAPGFYVCTDKDELMNFAAAFDLLDSMDELDITVNKPFGTVRFVMDKPKK